MTVDRNGGLQANVSNGKFNSVRDNINIGLDRRPAEKDG